VGWFDNLVFVRRVGGEVAPAFRQADVLPVGEAAGWTVGRMFGGDSKGFRSKTLRDAANDLDETVALLAQAGKAPTLGAWIYDDDFAYVVAAAQEGLRCRLVVGRPYSTWYGDDEPARFLELARSGSGPEWKTEGPARLARWSKEYAPSPVSVERIEQLVGEAHSGAGTCVHQLLQEMNLPTLG
jgi:hypothetical protein